MLRYLVHLVLRICRMPIATSSWLCCEKHCAVLQACAIDEVRHV